MLWLKAYRERIERLVTEGSESSLTYAALECRMAIERLCYERLRIAHDYISHDDLKKWQPADIVNTLIQEVDENISSSFTLSMSTTPVDPVAGDLSKEESEALGYVEIGKQVGFDPKRLRKHWNVMGSFLHIPVPKSKGAQLPSYSDPEAIKKRIQQVLEELAPLETGTLVSSGIGETVSFECNCGATNMRRAELLKQGQVISCINPDCKERWQVEIDGKEIGFIWNGVKFQCHECGSGIRFPGGALAELGKYQRIKVTCGECGADNYLIWALRHEKRVQPPLPSSD